MTDSQPPVGWYPDPKDPWSERYWDGTAWTEQVRTKEDEGQSPAARAAASTMIEEPTATFAKREDGFWDPKDRPARPQLTTDETNRRPLLLGVLAGLAVGAAIAVTLIFGRDDEPDSASNSTTSAASATTTPQNDPEVAPTTNADTTGGPTTSAAVATPTPTTAAATSAPIPTTGAPLPDALEPLPVGEGAFGSVDEVVYSPATRQLRLRGWAMDGDQRAPVQVSVILDFAEEASVVADIRRPDLAPIYRNGIRHGFAFDITLPQGQHTYCVVAQNLGPGPEEATPLFCETRDV